MNNNYATTTLCVQIASIAADSFQMKFQSIFLVRTRPFTRHDTVGQHVPNNQ